MKRADEEGCPMTRARIGPEEAAHYRKHGFVVVPGLFDTDSLALWKGRLRAIIDGEVDPAEHMLVMRDVMVAKGVVKPRSRAEGIAKLQDFEEDPVLFGYARDPRVLNCVEALIGPDLFTLHTMLINKPPNVDGRHPLHQDIIYFPYRPGDRIVGTWTALDRATKENGCLVGIPGSHRMEIAPHEHPDWEHVNLGYLGVQGLGPDERRVHFELEPGDTLFFHPHLVHGSGRNRTQGFRRSILTHYASADCEFQEAIASALPQRYYVPVRGRRPIR
jgi:phytanoyl-CoA hydroxylase